MDLGLGFEQRPEDRQGAFLDHRGEIGLFDERGDVLPMARGRWLPLDLDVDLQAPEMGALGIADRDSDREAELGHARAELRRGHPEVEEGPEDHVAAQARLGVQIHILHRRVVLPKVT